MIGNVQSGGTVAEVMSELETSLKSLAEVNGYTILDEEPPR